MFYSCFIALAGLVPADDIGIGENPIDYSNATGTSYVVEGDTNTTGVYSPNPVYEDYTWTTPFTNFIDNLFLNITGMPTIIIALVFTPLGIIGAYWLIRFIKSFIPLLGGGGE